MCLQCASRFSAPSAHFTFSFVFLSSNILILAHCLLQSVLKQWHKISVRFDLMYNEYFNHMFIYLNLLSDVTKRGHWLRKNSQEKEGRKGEWEKKEKERRKEGRNKAVARSVQEVQLHWAPYRLIIYYLNNIIGKKMNNEKMKMKKKNLTSKQLNLKRLYCYVFLFVMSLYGHWNWRLAFGALAD